MEVDTFKPLLPLGLDPDEQTAPKLEDQEEKSQGRGFAARVWEDRNAL